MPWTSKSLVLLLLLFAVQSLPVVAAENPAKVWQVYPKKGAIRLGSDGDITVVDMDKEATIDVNKLHSKNKPSPWHGWKVKGMPVLTVVRGRVQMRDGEPCGKPDRKSVV